ncbi:MAG: hypothetical protein ABIK28_24070 [Planctomycetota bacterium]
MFKRLLIPFCTVIETVLVWTEPILANQMDTVPKRVKALQRHWPGGNETAADLWVSFISFILIVAFVGAVLAWILCVRRKSKKARLTEDLSKKAGLTPKEIQLVHQISNEIEKIEPYEMLISIASFDRTTGAFLKDYCRRDPEPGPVIAGLGSIRKKLAEIRPVPASGLPGLGRISMLSRVGIRDEERKDSKTAVCWVVERQANHLRMIGLNETMAQTWQEGDALRMKVMVGDHKDTEILVRFEKLESRASGLFLVEYDFPCSPIEDKGSIRKEMNFPVKIGRSNGNAEQVLLDGLGREWAQISSSKACFAGERITLYSDLERKSKDKGSLATVVYCCILPNEEEYKIGLRFENALEIDGSDIAGITNPMGIQHPEATQGAGAPQTPSASDSSDPATDSKESPTA